MELFYALIPVFAWGTWLAPAQRVRFPNQQVKTLYVALANLVLASLVLLGQGSGSLAFMSPAGFWLIFSGGAISALSSLCAFVATDRLSIARAFGIWASLNIVTSMLRGALLFVLLTAGYPAGSRSSPVPLRCSCNPAVSSM
jgi:glucose uptake protein